MCGTLRDPGSRRSPARSTCPHSRLGWKTPVKESKNSRGRSFVNELVAEDYNFDGYVDLRAPREYAASFQNYCVWLYDPASRTFVRDNVAQKMEELENFRVDRTRQLIIAGGLNGGIGVHSEEYRIARGQGKEPARLVPVQS